jgi:hypothetical protein
MDPGSAVARALLSGWRLSGITRLRSGTPYGTIGATCNLPNAGGCNASYNPAFSGPVRINGEWGDGNLLGGAAAPTFLDSRAFISPAAFAYGDTAPSGAYGLYNPGFWNVDFNVTRRFAVTERVSVAFAAESFNLFNTVIFNGPASLAFNNANFGKITGQQNSPRSFQLSLKVLF